MDNERKQFFAAMAMQGFIGKLEGDSLTMDLQESEMELIAAKSFDMAESMVKMSKIFEEES